MTTKTERAITALVGISVLFTAMINPIFSIGIAIIFLTSLILYKYLEARKPRNKTL